MKNIVLKVPTAIFIVLVLLPSIIFVFQKLSGEVLLRPPYYEVLSVIGSIATWIWLFSVVDYFYFKAPHFKHIRLIYLLLIAGFTLVLIDIFFLTDLSWSADLVLLAIRTALFVPALIFITQLIHAVFYERAVWFIVLEQLIMIIGITTLTPEIKRNEKDLSEIN